MTGSADQTLSSPTPRALSALLDELRVKVAAMEQVTIGTLIEALHERGIGVLMLFFAAPMALPVPKPPPLTFVFGIPLLLLACQQALGRYTVWMPAKTRSREIPRDKLIDLIGHLVPWIRRIEYVIRPRMGWVTHGALSRFFGCLAVIMALSVCAPMPLANTVPSIGICLMATGAAIRDGLALLAGAIMGTAWVVMIWGAVIIFGPDVLAIIKETIKSLI